MWIEDGVGVGEAVGGDVLVGHQVPGDADPALARAILEAHLRGRRLQLITTWTPEVSTASAALSAAVGAPAPLLQEDPEGFAERESSLDLWAALDRVDPSERVAATTTVLARAPGPVLAQLSGACDLVVVGASSKPRWRHALMRSTVGLLLRQCRAPLMLVPADAPVRRFARVVLWLNPWCANPSALRWAHDAAVRHGCSLEVVVVVDGNSFPPDDGLGLHEPLRDLDAFVAARESLEGRTRIRTRLLCGDTARVLAESSGPNDLLVVPATPTTRVLGWLTPTVAERCAERMRSALVVLPPDPRGRRGSTSPVHDCQR